MAEPRSGDRVLITAERLVPLMAILSPWIAGGVDWLQAHVRYTQLGEGYAKLVEAAIFAYLPVLIARLHMRSIRKADEQELIEQRIASLRQPDPVLVRPTNAPA